MTHLSKTVLALLLLAGGFIAARTFGPPDLAQKLVDHLRPEPANQWGELRPAQADQHQAEYLAPLDAVEMPASFSSAYSQQMSAPETPTPQQPALSNNWPAMPTLSQSSAADVAFSASGIEPSAYQTRMAPLRAAPAVEQPPQSYEAAKPVADQWPAPPEAAWQPAEQRQPPLAPPEGYEPWNPQAAIAASAPTQFAGYPSATGAAPLDAPITPPAMWRNEQSDRLAPLASQTNDPEEANAYRTHIVADGDSLPRLAQRYLGDASRSEEIFEKNRDLLTHPDLLPLGVELKLP